MLKFLSSQNQPNLKDFTYNEEAKWARIWRMREDLGRALFESCWFAPSSTPKESSK